MLGLKVYAYFLQITLIQINYKEMQNMKFTRQLSTVLRQLIILIKLLELSYEYYCPPSFHCLRALDINTSCPQGLLGLQCL